MSEEEIVTVTIARKITPGREADYEAWVKGIADVAQAFRGNLGMKMLKPSLETGDEYVTVFRFNNYKNLRIWADSDERALWVSKLEEMVESETVHKVTGLEFWFSLPEAPVNKPPSPHKMALVLCVVVFTLVLGMNVFLGDWLSTLPLLARVAFVVIAQVLLMTYIIMPQVTKLLKSWLFK
ncbi:MAG: antibiotic biosynthesis monooxygenase [Rhodospirillales bacterium]|nr:antibiotic biosynthesis monooxygenase [Rhodospirillales bacterium]